MNFKRIGSKVKGFTLVELIVVMAIIAILAGILSMFISGFQRDARIERNNNYARMVFTGFQNILIQSEIEQDDSMFTPDPSLGDLKGVCIYFHIASEGNGTKYERNRLGNKIQFIVVPKTGFNINTCMAVYTETGGENPANGAALSDTGEMYSKWQKAILGNIDESFEGTVAVYIDYENYEVDSVAFRELENGSDPTIEETNLKSYNLSGDGDYRFCGLDNMTDSEEIVKRTGKYYGVYPYRDALN